MQTYGVFEGCVVSHAEQDHEILSTFQSLPRRNLRKMRNRDINELERCYHDLKHTIKDQSERATEHEIGKILSSKGLNCRGSQRMISKLTNCVLIREVISYIEVK